MIWHDFQTVILVPSSLSLFKFCLEANTFFSLLTLLILYWLNNPTLTPFKVIFKTGNRFHQVNDSKVRYMLISRSYSQSQKTSQALIWVKRESGVSCEVPQRYRAILLEPASTEVRKKIKGGKKKEQVLCFCWRRTHYNLVWTLGFIISHFLLDRKANVIKTSSLMRTFNMNMNLFLTHIYLLSPSLIAWRQLPNCALYDRIAKENMPHTC